VRIRSGARADEVEVRSYVLTYRSRGDAAQHNLISGERHESLRRVNGSWKLARRAFVVDQATLGTKNLVIFV